MASVTRPFRLGVGAVDSVTRLVGNTPLLRLRRVAERFPSVEVFAKLEYFNPGGSVKDRAALQMVQEARSAGVLSPGKRLIDSTSGNTGVAYSWIGAALGIPVTLVMPSNVSAARKQISAAFGAEIIYSDPMEGSDGAIRLAKKLVGEHPDRYFYPDQYANEANPRAHQLTTAPEIWEQTAGRVTHFVCGIGTGGSVMGIGRGLKGFRSGIQVIAVEPLEPLHGLEGLKHMASSIVPPIYREAELDEKLSVATDEGWDMADRLLDLEGLAVGHSSGAAAVGALRVARRLHEQGRPGVVVTLFPDRADRYFEPARWRRTFDWRLPPLPADLAEAVRHVEAAYPSEGCGVVVQQRDGRFRIHPLRNAYDELHARNPVGYPRTSRTAYALDAREQQRIWRQAEEEGGRICCIFHSHADVGSYFSAEDQAMAAPEGEPLFPGVCYLVIAVDAGRATAAKCFWWEDRDFREAPVSLASP